jgi:hypothetical protein
MSRRQAASSAHRDALPAKPGFLRVTREFGTSARRQIQSTPEIAIDLAVKTR